MSDPYWANVTLLLRGNSSPITDEKAGYTFTTQGTTPSISTSVKKFGAGSISFAGNGHIRNEDYDNTFAGFGTGNFTIEFWIKTTQVGTTGSWYNGSGIIDADVSGGGNDFGISLNGNKLSFGIGSPDYTLNSLANINDGLWKHIAVTRTKSTGAVNIYIMAPALPSLLAPLS